jgi:hypothetical protein
MSSDSCFVVLCCFWWMTQPNGMIVYFGWGIVISISIL